MIYDNILATIGSTPIVRLNRLAPPHVQMYVKVESFNPGASVKDRLAYAIIQDARDSGALQPGQTVVEATSGNTGIALAMVCAVFGHPFVATMAESFSRFQINNNLLYQISLEFLGTLVRVLPCKIYIILFLLLASL